MEHLEFELSGGAKRPVPGRPYAVAGLVASSNLEVLAEAKALDGKVRFIVDTKTPGFGETWNAVFADFVERNQPGDVQFSVNDFSAIPPVVSLRLDQAWEALSD